MKRINLTEFNAALNTLRQYHAVDEIVVRNIQIKRTYRKLKRTYPKRKSEAKQKLADQYCISVDALHSILYDPKYTKGQEPIIDQLK